MRSLGLLLKYFGLTRTGVPRAFVEYFREYLSYMYAVRLCFKFPQVNKLLI